MRTGYTSARTEGEAEESQLVTSPWRHEHIARLLKASASQSLHRQDNHDVTRWNRGGLQPVGTGHPDRPQLSQVRLPEPRAGRNTVLKATPGTGTKGTPL